MKAKTPASSVVHASIAPLLWPHFESQFPAGTTVEQITRKRFRAAGADRIADYEVVAFLKRLKAEGLWHEAMA